MASCLGKNEDTTTYYYETAVSSFSIGTLKRTVHTRSSKGEDSTYVTTVNASGYKFNIDQLSGTISNPDSLPVGTHIDKVLCSISSVNGGIVTLYNEATNTANLYSSTDSIDFSTPRKLRVYPNAGGNEYKEYTVTINVHKEQPDTFLWNKAVVAEQAKTLEAMRATAVGTRLYVAGTRNGTEKLYTFTSDAPAQWTEVNVPLQAGDHVNLVGNGTQAFVLSGATLYTLNADGTPTQSTVSGIARLIGATATKLYAYNTAGAIVWANAPFTEWTTTELDDQADRLPQKDISMVSAPLVTNPDMERITLIGNRTDTADSTAVVWQLLDTPTATADRWSFFGLDRRYSSSAPRLNHLQVVGYGSTLLAIGGKGLDKYVQAPFAQVWESTDNALTWQQHSTCYLPTGFSAPGEAFALTVDANNYLWLIAGGSGQVWKGRLTQLTWQQPQRVFNE